MLTASNVPAQPGLFYQGDSLISGGMGSTFGDGLRCCGVNLVRLEVVVGVNPQPTSVSSSVTISTHPGQGSLPGTTKCYQYWYRNPGSSPCGTDFNLSNAVTITWQ